ncbi:hypothetical protein CDD83_8596 [Cordyceps sp. RAO-2017]|nr:hypothetical protein CDD83_8596 [Cordyceps sp. RAO-2017]
MQQPSNAINIRPQNKKILAPTDDGMTGMLGIAALSDAQGWCTQNSNDATPESPTPPPPPSGSPSPFRPRASAVWASPLWFWSCCCPLATETRRARQVARATDGPQTTYSTGANMLERTRSCTAAAQVVAWLASAGSRQPSTTCSVRR